MLYCTKNRQRSYFSIALRDKLDSLTFKALDINISNCIDDEHSLTSIAFMVCYEVPMNYWCIIMKH